MRVITLTDLHRIRGFLLTDPFFADYALGDLDPAYFQFTEWFGAEEDDGLHALVMVYRDLTPPILFALGEARGLELLLDQAVQLPEIGLSIRAEQLPSVEKFYQAEPVPMLKMALLPEDFKPVDAQSSRGVLQAMKQFSSAADETALHLSTPQQNGAALLRKIALTRLDISHLPQLVDLYTYGGGDAFRRRSLEQGVFYGVFEGERVVAVAGTHIVSDREHVAALGNVMTHPDYRGRGFATVATSAVCRELLDRGIQLIGLSVGQSNEPAIQVYEKLGFKRKAAFYEGTATRKRQS